MTQISPIHTTLHSLPCQRCSPSPPVRSISIYLSISITDCVSLTSIARCHQHRWFDSTLTQNLKIHLHPSIRFGSSFDGVEQEIECMEKKRYQRLKCYVCREALMFGLLGAVLDLGVGDSNGLDGFCIEIVGNEVVMVDEIPFPRQITTTKSLSLLGHGITDIEIHFLQIKFTAIGVYLEPEIVGHLQQWKGKPGNVLAEDDDFFEALISAPVEKFLRIVVIKEIKGSQYGVQLESAVRDRLAADDKYEDEEEAALEKVVEFLQSKYFKKDSVITYHFPANSATAEIAISTEGKEDSKIKVENANVVEVIKKWYLGGTRGVSPTTIASLANTLSAELSK
ncbi:probable chalcone--flavonone isomerase 3 [Fagus crenata]